jgi:hypothetical protein
MLFSRNKIQIDVYINYGKDNVRQKKLLAEPGISALDALEGAADIEYTANESASGHLEQWFQPSMDSKWISIISGFIISLRKTRVAGDCQYVLPIHLGFQRTPG